MVAHDAMVGNVGNILAFRTGERDASFLARDYGTGYTPQEFTSLPNRHVLAKVLKDGIHHEPFVGHIDSGTFRTYGRTEKLIALSRRRYGVPGAKVEDRINRWLP